MKKFLKLALCNGVTTLRDVGNHLETIIYLKKWVLKNDAPMIYSSGPSTCDLAISTGNNF